MYPGCRWFLISEYYIVCLCFVSYLVDSYMHTRHPLYIDHVGERLESGIKNVLLLQSDEAIVVTAQEEFDDTLPDGA